MIGWVCPSCGVDMTAELTSTTADEMVTFTEELRHYGPMDAACRLVFETLADERKRLLDIQISAAMESIRRQL